MIQGYAAILVYSVMYEIGVSTVKELDSTMLEIMLLFLFLICNAGIHYHHCRQSSCTVEQKARENPRSKKIPKEGRRKSVLVLLPYRRNFFQKNIKFYTKR